MGRGLLQVRACTPLHTAEQVVSHSDQPPSTGGGGARSNDDDEPTEAAQVQGYVSERGELGRPRRKTFEKRKRQMRQGNKKG